MTARRCFVALELKPAVVATLLGVREALRELAPTWRDEKWVAENNLHVTLKFLGNVEIGELDALRSDLDTALASVQSFSMQLRTLRAVPAHGRSSMIWATFADSDGHCAALAAAVDDIAEAHGVVHNTKTFTPHVTLVRARKPRKLPPDALSSTNALLATHPVSMSVRSATLFASTLTGTGPVYDRIDMWAIRPEC